jgi:hypothetical protein
LFGAFPKSTPDDKTRWAQVKALIKWFKNADHFGVLESGQTMTNNSYHRTNVVLAVNSRMNNGNIKEAGRSEGFEGR